jgi:PAS domain S-box-containing protein
MSLILVGTLIGIALIGSGVYLARSRQWASERENWIKDLNNQKYALDQHAIVSVSDLQGHITYANDRFCQISGYTQKELLGQSHRLINAGVHPEEFFETLWGTIAQSRVWHNEMCCRKKNGEVFWVNATIVPFLDVDEQVQQYIAISTDITDRKQAETSLQIAKETAEQATGAKSQFLANMSHEIRTPMNAILGLLQLLQRTEMDGTQKAYVTQTENSARALLGLLNDILDFSKVEAGQMQLDAQAFRVRDWVRELSVILTHNLGHKPVQVKVDIDPNLPDTLLGDDMRLRQILINLGSNAIKFTEQGEVLIRFAQIQRQQKDVTLRFSVTDTGIGIAPEHLSRIFEGFSQAEASTTRRFGGTGLGLSICKQLVNMMGGELQVRSTPGQGSEFAFTLTLIAAPSAPERPVASLTATTKTQRLKGMRLLVVEDNAINQMVAQKLLTQEGAEVTLADNGELGMRAAITAEPGFDAVLMDVQMPVMDGYEAAKAIGLHMGSKQPPIIAMTANAMASDRQACLKAGMKDHIGKPFMLDQLVALLHRHTQHKAQESAVPAPD